MNKESRCVRRLPISAGYYQPYLVAVLPVPEAAANDEPRLKIEHQQYKILNNQAKNSNRDLGRGVVRMYGRVR
ncbi:hypothetical protein [Burkholderia ubonensis]|uniref:hypothetical protein n=1 Tax=Burkholderia ubonensis TaxID=101571 RepID=UPI001054CD47|nr:hypothetical protein [Burkholderia ubonensis]